MHSRHTVQTSKPFAPSLPLNIMLKLKSKVIEDVVENLINAEAEARETLRDTVDKLTRLGKFSPTIDKPTEDFSEEKRNKLVSDLKEQENDIFNKIDVWNQREEEMPYRVAKSIAHDQREEAKDQLAEEGLPLISRNPRSQKRLSDEDRAERDRKLDELTEFSALKALFDEDNEAWEPYAEKERWLRANEHHTSNKSAQKRARRGAKAAKKKVDESEKKKEKLRDDILKLFPVLEVSAAGSLAATPPRASQSTPNSPTAPSRETEGGSTKRKRADSEQVE